MIIARGKLTGRTDYTRLIALKHHKQLLGIDLNLTNHYAGASLVASWIDMQHIQVLNVAGPRASEGPAIYSDVCNIFELTIPALRDEMSRSDAKPKELLPSIPPKTVGEAVERLVAELSLKEKAKIANMAGKDLIELYLTLGLYIRNKFLFPNNKKLLNSCRYHSMDKYLDMDQAPTVIIKRLWEELRKSHRLRIVD